MAQMLLRNLDDTMVAVLKERAKKHGRSLSSEVRAILQDATGSRADWRQQLEQVRAMFDGRSFSDSTDLLREDRER